MNHPDLHARARALFHDVAELSPEEQRRVLDACDAPPAVVDEVRSLLGWDRRVAAGDDAIEQVGRQLIEAVDEARLPPGEQRIGPYELLEVLGTGGMGVVYLAQQLEPVRREVALKVVKLGYDTKEVLARFALERRTLAAMSHNGIARVFDAGETERGQPYFVMELVRGLPLTEFCDRNRLTLKARIDLFREVCSAVQHAHQRGVIHRDLKPGNILVAEEGGLALPKILDFGLARATDQDPAASAFRTSGDGVLGTPEYMAPEQAAGFGAPLDIRADIYSLGVILYELLTGQLPFDSRQLRRAGWGEIRRVLEQVEPPKPSSRVMDPAEERADLASQRRTTQVALGRSLRGDLDWIVLKALSKEPERRYESATDLAEDLRRWIDNEPVLASPPSVSYRLTKFVRRYRLQVLAAAAVLVALVAGSIGTAIGLVRAERRAAENEQLAQTNRALATAEGEARVRAQKSLDDFRLLATVQLLIDAKERETTLYPAYPDRVEAMAAWLDEYGDPLTDRLPTIEQALGSLLQKAIPVSAAELQAWRAAQPPSPELQAARVAHASRQRAASVRRGEGQVQLPLLHAQLQGRSARDLDQLAWSAVNPNKPEFGMEGMATAAARAALQQVDAGDPTVERHRVLLTLAWAYQMLGDDDEARRWCSEAERICPADALHEFAEHERRLDAAIAGWAGERGEAQLAQLADEVARLERANEPEPRFADGSDAFLYRTIERLVADLRSFTGPGGVVAAVRVRLEQARTIGVRSIDAHRDAWNDAIEAIAAAPRYRGLKLTPQVGLVPIGADPESGLWEFVHLDSGMTDEEFPPRDPTSGRLVPTADMGIVFVLLPGGRFVMGAQRLDAAGPNFDPDAQPRELPHEVTLAPFFLGKYELTQGQFARLWDGEENRRWPSAYRVGQSFRGIPDLITPRHPVEAVDWTMCNRVMEHHGLMLPTEAQWEFGCRAGTSSVYYTGNEAASLVGHENILDEDATELYPHWGRPEAFRDGFAGAAPVGTFPGCNAFGLFDMHGNVIEWCRDWSGSYELGWRPGDGLSKADDSSGHRVHRGGGYNRAAVTVRSAVRGSELPTVINAFIGVRAARSIDR